jgi:hypothetical protein
MCRILEKAAQIQKPAPAEAALAGVDPQVLLKLNLIW